jgi:hypothetical protein
MMIVIKKKCEMRIQQTDIDTVDDDESEYIILSKRSYRFSTDINGAEEAARQ